MNPDTTTQGLLKVSGPDAKKLLQGQLTCNVDALLPNQSVLSALCNREGRVISLFRLFLLQDDYFLFMGLAMVPITLAALKKYAVFYKVALTDASETLPSFTSLEEYADIQKGLPAIYPETSGLFLPHDINLQEHNIINFNKGCFTGQEIIARMHYKAKLKKHLYTASIHTLKQIKPGMDVYITKNHETLPVGIIVDASAAKHHHLVLLTIEESLAKNDSLFLSEDKHTYFNFNVT